MSPGSAPLRRWIICADDFGLDRGGIDATIALIERGRVTATSALTDSPLWPEAARALSAASGGAGIGLHLNLTEPLESRDPGGSHWPLPVLILRCWSGALALGVVRDAIHRQLDRFEDAIGRGPDFVDGHQHVHQFARVRDELVGCLAARYPGSLPWLRNTRPPARIRDLKAGVISRLGARRLCELAAARSIATNTAFVGVYGFEAEPARWLAHLGRWVAAGPDATVLMCHPSTRPRPQDPIGPARRMEAGLLGGGAFAALLTAAGIVATSGRSLPPLPPGSQQAGAG